jgi:hypothetical protein
MPKAYSSDLRERLIETVASGDVGDRHGSRVWRQHLRTLLGTCCYLIRRKDLQ